MEKMAQHRIITLDGPAGSGKSTVASQIALRLGYLHADSGALYRSLTLACIRRLGARESADAFGDAFARGAPTPASIDLRVEVRSGQQFHLLDGMDVGQEIRSPEVTGRIRYIADDPGYRDRVNALLRELAAQSPLICDGRDIGTVVFPGTPYKFYLDADVHTRAVRRQAEFVQRGMDASDLSEIERQIAMRDEEDRNRKIGALQIPPGAILIDTSRLDRDMVVSSILAHLQELF